MIFNLFWIISDVGTRHSRPLLSYDDKTLTESTKIGTASAILNFYWHTRVVFERAAHEMCRAAVVLLPSFTTFVSWLEKIPSLTSVPW